MTATLTAPPVKAAHSTASSAASAPVSEAPGEPAGEAAILHELQAQRFSQTVGSHLCVLTYQLDGDTVTFNHTGVHRDLRGRSLAANLVQAGLAWARTERLRVAPACSYVHAYMQRHPETLDLL